jgi:hypothetical protein
VLAADLNIVSMAGLVQASQRSEQLLDFFALHVYLPNSRTKAALQGILNRREHLAQVLEAGPLWLCKS